VPPAARVLVVYSLPKGDTPREGAPRVAVFAVFAGFAVCRVCHTHALPHHPACLSLSRAVADSSHGCCFTVLTRTLPLHLALGDSIASFSCASPQPSQAAKPPGMLTYDLGREGALLTTGGLPHGTSCFLGQPWLRPRDPEEAQGAAAPC
jgi:hypothetical protein